MNVTKSISFKLIFSALIIVTILVISFGVYDYMAQSNLLKNKQINQLSLVESRLKLNLPSAVWNYEEDQMKGILNSEQQSEDIALIEITNEAKKTISQSKGKKTNEAITFKLQHLEDGQSTSVGNVTLFIDSSSIDIELSSLASRIIVKGVLLDVFLISAIYFLFAKLVTQPLSEVANALENIARGEGDLTQRLCVKRKDEIGLVAESFNVFVDKIQLLVQSIQLSVKQTSEVSENVYQASEASRGHLENQQSETDQVATAITEMSASAKEIANNVQLTAGSAEQANQDARAVSAIIKESIESINGLSDHLNEATKVVGALEDDVKGIVSVLDVIRGIAEQTNLLALNAAIEAARAGEQGRGFAVVADEVRALASRTQESTAQIQQTIERLQSGAKSAVHVMEDSQTKSKASVENALSSGESISSILNSTEQITEMATQIASAVEEQSTVAEELSSNVNRIVSAGHSSLEQLNAMTKNSQLMQSSSDELNKLTQQFKA
ncbi:MULTISPECIES: methyl-accepting chemotaxis protein [unclassified Colwellia]|uniref:methyl-accepting chemotaxis protein n=1 Tax=unclassified Colwellia TaxID=196834 RepID=UPI0015F497E9|nr:MULTISPECIES: methyl-accepting chemotaxis protein [unclassified Colwellia]MBA6233920.1 methyl-accepting chemotaxis protein [Colwellia sp. MB02u-7]MBA6237606.1 methyl-accepting chemotaxis protein [Colwellia sp. MB02u-11]MBA6256059.1 methyl-accepting chemotaxis protein [Colwellia sp. MB3u-28]MBA6260792.1 methyl-accepting chemotaxis protein [Colwellia sp. MB3u-41]MBA6300593.1 methyl-accepting chemotaxis protein [Colwellia sp. MB3u-22]